MDTKTPERGDLRSLERRRIKDIERIELQSLYILKSSLTVLLEEATGAKTPKRK